MIRLMYYMMMAHDDDDMLLANELDERVVMWDQSVQMAAVIPIFTNDAL